MSLNPTTKAFADVLGMEALVKNQHHLTENLKLVCEFYKDCTEILGVDHSIPFFMEIVKKAFSESEIVYLIKSAKGFFNMKTKIITFAEYTAAKKR